MELRSYGVKPNAWLQSGRQSLLTRQLVKELWSYGVKELSQMLGCRENDNPCQLTRHTTPLSPRRGAGGEAGCSLG